MSRKLARGLPLRNLATLCSYRLHSVIAVDCARQITTQTVQNLRSLTSAGLLTTSALNLTVPNQMLLANSLDSRLLQACLLSERHPWSMPKT